MTSDHTATNGTKRILPVFTNLRAYRETELMPNNLCFVCREQTLKTSKNIALWMGKAILFNYEQSSFTQEIVSKNLDTHSSEKRQTIS